MLDAVREKVGINEDVVWRSESCVVLKEEGGRNLGSFEG